MKSILTLSRVYQYPKNLFVLTPVFFSGQLFLGHQFYLALLTMIAFCLMSSAMYIFNDWMDMDLDRQHPVKKNRPLASGSVIPPFAFLMMIIFLLLGLLMIACINWSVLIIAAAYLILMTAYSIWLKHQPVLDLLIIALGFILRIFAGGLATNIVVSPYLVMMTFFLALFLALGKRHDEFNYCRIHKITPRPALKGYSNRLFDIAISSVITLMVLGYFMYTVTAVNSQLVLKSPYLYLTTFFVIAGAMRYLQLIYVKKNSSDPSYLLFHDGILLSLVLLWSANLFVILYVF